MSSEKNNSVPPLSFQIERQARIKRSLVIQGCIRGIVRALAEWLRSVILRSTQLARGLAAQRRICSDIRDLQRFNDRMLADIGVTLDRGPQFDGQIAAVNAQILSRASIVAFQLCAAASICFVTGGATVAESATSGSPICDRPQARHTDRGARRSSRCRSRDLGASVLHRDGSAQGLQSGAGQIGHQALRNRSTPTRNIPPAISRLPPCIHNTPCIVCDSEEGNECELA